MCTNCGASNHKIDYCYDFEPGTFHKRANFARQMPLTWPYPVSHKTNYEAIKKGDNRFGPQTRGNGGLLIPSSQLTSKAPGEVSLPAWFRPDPIRGANLFGSTMTGGPSRDNAYTSTTEALSQINTEAFNSPAGPKSRLPDMGHASHTAYTTDLPLLPVSNPLRVQGSSDNFTTRNDTLSQQRVIRVENTRPAQTLRAIELLFYGYPIESIGMASSPTAEYSTVTFPSPEVAWQAFRGTGQPFYGYKVLVEIARKPGAPYLATVTFKEPTMKTEVVDKEDEDDDDGEGMPTRRKRVKTNNYQPEWHVRRSAEPAQKINKRRAVKGILHSTTQSAFAGKELTVRRADGVESASEKQNLDTLQRHSTQPDAVSQIADRPSEPNDLNIIQSRTFNWITETALVPHPEVLLERKETMKAETAVVKGRRALVEGLKFDTTIQDLGAYFRDYAVKDIVINYKPGVRKADAQPGPGGRYAAYIDFATADEANRAISEVPSRQARGDLVNGGSNAIKRNTINIYIEGERHKKRREKSKMFFEKQKENEKQEVEEEHDSDSEDNGFFLRISDLPFETTEADIRDFLGGIKATSITLPSFVSTTCQTGYAIIEFPNLSQQRNGLHNLPKKILRGEHVTISPEDDTEELRAGTGPLMKPTLPDSLNRWEEVGLGGAWLFREAVLVVGEQGGGLNRRVLREWWREKGVWLDI